MTKLKASLEMMAIIIAVHVIVVCSYTASNETRQWHPIAIDDFKNVA